MRPHRATAIVLAVLTAVAASGCLMVGRSEPPPPPPPAPPVGPRIEYALGEFTFQMNERDPIRSHFDARLLGAEIFDHWEQRGYVSDAERVDADGEAADGGDLGRERLEPGLRLGHVGGVGQGPHDDVGEHGGLLGVRTAQGRRPG